MSPTRRHPGIAFAWPLVLVALFALRLPHLGGPLDNPHSWRQCDTVNYTWQFFRHGIDLLHPRVCWLGGAGTLIFEFPLPEALAALLDRAFGFTPLWDRVVALAFTALSAFWFHRIVRELADTATARIATAIYLVAPLTQFYSRAPQVDFAAQAFAHGLLWHGWRSLRGGGWPHALAAAACGALAAMIKVPYVLPVLAPLALLVAGAGSLMAVAGVAFALVVMGGVFLLWRSHVNAVNGAVPDWTFLPGFYKEVNPWWWYIGEWRTRLVPHNWITLVRRLVFEIVTPAGAVLAAAALVHPLPRREGGPSPLAFALLWLLGSLVYASVFFPLNLIHDYYQVPFVAPLALLAALGVRGFADARHALPVRALAWTALVAVVALALLLPRRLHFYATDSLREVAGAAIAARVPEADLVIVVDHNTEYSDPRLLFRARRNGWPIMKADLSPALTASLVGVGARWVAWVREHGDSLLVPPMHLAPMRVAAVPLVRSETDGKAERDTLLLYRLTSGEPTR